MPTRFGPSRPCRSSALVTGVAIQANEDIALQEARRRGWTTFGDLDDQQAALLAAGQVFGLTARA